METKEKSTWKPTTAGILNIISGAISALSVFGLIIAIIATSNLNFLSDFVRPQDIPFATSLLSSILIVILVFSIIEAAFPLVGGVFALQRKRWGWALAGSIISILSVFPLGVASTIFVAMAKDEFE